MRDLLDHLAQTSIENRPGGAGERARPDTRRDPLERPAGSDPDAHGRQRALVCLSLLLAPKRELPTRRRWA